MPETPASTTTIVPTTTAVPIATTTNATTVVPQSEPWWPHVTFEAGGLLAAGIAIIVYIESRVEKRRREDKERDKLEHDAIIQKVADATHKVGNLSSRQDAIELNRSKDIERIVKLETNQINFEKGQSELKSEMREGFKDIKTEILNAISTHTEVQNSRNEVIDKQIANVVESLRVMRGDYDGGGKHKP